jgi:hypothetical protein
MDGHVGELVAVLGCRELDDERPAAGEVGAVAQLRGRPGEASSSPFEGPGAVGAGGDDVTIAACVTPDDGGAGDGSAAT